MNEDLKERVKLLAPHLKLKFLDCLIDRVDWSKSDFVYNKLRELEETERFVIRKGVLIPPKGYSNTELLPYIKKLEVGDSILLPMKYYNQVHAFQKTCLIKLDRRKLNDFEFGVWRTA